MPATRTRYQRNVLITAEQRRRHQAWLDAGEPVLGRHALLARLCCQDRARRYRLMATGQLVQRDHQPPVTLAHAYFAASQARTHRLTSRIR